MNKIVVISIIDIDGLETEVSYGEAVEFIGKESVDDAIEAAKAGCNSAIEVDDDSNIVSVAFRLNKKNETDLY